jgi:hypothetical protein
MKKICGDAAVGTPDPSALGRTERGYSGDADRANLAGRPVAAPQKACPDRRPDLFAPDRFEILGQERFNVIDVQFEEGVKPGVEFAHELAS